MSSRKKLLIIFGTRPEAIKMAPIINLLQHHNNFKPIICITSQHQQILLQVLKFFNIHVDYDLKIMKKDQTLFDTTINILDGLRNVLNVLKPDLLLVHGDTTTTMAATISGFYTNIKIAHIEAGLRSHNMRSPYPEEANRKIISHLVDYHLVPTKLAEENLLQENITKNIHIVGNTVVDALLLGLAIIKHTDQLEFYQYFSFLDFNKKIIFITVHRRENFGKPLENIMQALKFLANKYPDISFVYPVHPNPNVALVANEILEGISNIFLIKPLDYQYTIWLMSKSYFIITDSGGIQEEAPSLQKPLLIVRDITERIEGVKANIAKLVGSDASKLIEEADKLLNDENYYNNMISIKNPYGDGKAAERIINILERALLNE